MPKAWQLCHGSGMELNPQQLATALDQLDKAKDDLRDLVATACGGKATNQAIFNKGIALAKRLLVCRAILGMPPDCEKSGGAPC